MEERNTPRQRVENLSHWVFTGGKQQVGKKKKWVSGRFFWKPETDPDCESLFLSCRENTLEGPQ